MTNMGEFATLIEFVPDYIGLADKTVDSVKKLLDCDEKHAEQWMRQAGLLLKLKDIFKDNPKLSLQDAKKATDMSDDEADVYAYAMQICFPESLSFQNIKDVRQGERLNTLKKDSAVQFMINNDIDIEIISKKFKVPIKKLKRAKDEKLLPTVYEENKIVRRLKKENKIRDFFKLYPHSTAKEAAKFLNLKVQDVRKTAERLRNCGENILFNNVTPVMEREQAHKRIIELKKDNPALTNQEISMQLGLPVSEIRNALQNAIKIWQIEKATNYDFIFTKTNFDLEQVKEEAWNRHTASQGSSSRWLEIFLIATEKQIAMHGLKAPEKVDITQEYRLSKDQRDQIIQAAMATEAVDVEFNNIEVTGELNG